eukprot:659360-Pyramimonas_sp.AAC.1
MTSRLGFSCPPARGGWRPPSSTGFRRSRIFCTIQSQGWGPNSSRPPSRRMASSGPRGSSS